MDTEPTENGTVDTGGPSQNPKTTTISTIAVQSGKTRLVIALLQNGDWIQLKILEVEPELTKLGATLSEALELQKTHDEVLLQLQNKQSPVEELLRQADQLISTQRPRAEVYAAMADSLGRAWNDVNQHLELRKHILDLNVLYQRRADEFYQKIDELEASCKDTMVPIEIEAVKRFLTNIHDQRRAVLETLMAALQAGNQLLAKLKELGMDGTLDSRPERIRASVNRAISQVEKWLDDLHVKRQFLEISWQTRKTQLEQCLALALLAKDLRELEDTVSECRELLANSDQLGDSSSSAELLHHEHKKLLPEARQLQERAIKITKATEQLVASGCFAGEEATAQAYTVLADTSDYLSDLDARDSLLTRTINFFRNAHTALTKLDQLEVQLTTSDLPSTLPQLVQLHSQCAQVIEDIVTAPLHEGHGLLDEAGRGHTATDGVKRMVEELENRKIFLEGLCVAHREENLRISQALTTFLEEQNELYSWLISIAEAFLQGHQDMGSDLPMAKDFLNLHNQLLNDLQTKGNEINSLLLTLPPILEYLNDAQRCDVDAKVESLHEHWLKLKNILEIRLDLAAVYVRFHTEADTVSKAMDELENSLRNSSPDVRDNIIEQLEERWSSLVPLYQQAKNTGLNFISQSTKVSEPYLDTKRACLCVESVLERLAGRQLTVTRNWQSFQTDLTERRELIIQWERTMTESIQTIDWVSKLDAQLYPIITSISTNPKDIATDLDRKLITVLNEIKRAQHEVEQRLKTADSLTQKSNKIDETALNIKNKLNELNQKLVQIITDYQVLLEMLISYFKNLTELDKTIENVTVQYTHGKLPIDLYEVETMIREHEASRQAILEMFKFTQNESETIISRIRRQEPANAAEHDIQKMLYILEARKKQWESGWNQRKDTLEQHRQLCQFNTDLHQINETLDDLSRQLAGVKGQYGESIASAKATSLAFVYFEKTIELLQQRIQVFVNTGEQLLADRHGQSPHIERELSRLRNRWSEFQTQVVETRRLIDLSIQYFQLVDEADEWFREGSKLLVIIARKSTSVKRPEEATELLNEVAMFLKPGEEKQNDRLKRITALAVEIYGIEHSKQVTQVMVENREMLDSFTVISNELNTLARNLKAAEEERDRLKREQEEADARLAVLRAEQAAALRAQQAAAALRAEQEAADLRNRLKREQEEALRAEQAAAALRAEQEAAALRDRLKREQEEAAALKAEQAAAALRAEQAAAALRAEQEAAALRDRLKREQEEAAALRAEQAAAALRAEQAAAALRAEQEAAALRDRLKREQEEADALRAEQAAAALRAEQTAAAVRAKQTAYAEEARKADEAAAKALREAVSVTEKKIEVVHLIKSEVRQRTPEKICEIIEEVHAPRPPDFIVSLTDAVIQEGSRFTFECQVIGYPIPCVTWHKDGMSIQNNPDYQTTFDQGVCTLTIEETFAEDSARYTCKGINAAGTAETGAMLSVKETEPEEQLIPPSFIKYLEPAIAKEGTTFTFECTVEGNPLPTVQWFKNYECIDNSPDFVITYNNGEAILKFEEVFLEDKAEYTCKASNELGTAQCTASLSVEPLEPTIAPEFVIPLSNVMARAGQKIKLECEVTGLPQPSLTWTHNGKQLKESRDLKLHCDNNRTTVVISEAFPKDAGTYVVTATNLAGEAASACNVSVKGRLPNETSDSEIASDMEPIKPSIQLALKDLSVFEGKRVRLDCVIVGQPEPEVIWYHDNRPVKESTDFQLLFQGDRCSLIIQEAFTEDAGEYKVIAINSAGEASSKCKLTVTAVGDAEPATRPTEEKLTIAGSWPKFSKLLSDVLVSEGDRVILECSVTGDPTPDIKWLLNNQEIHTSEHFKFTHDSDGNVKLEIEHVVPDDKGVYTVKASNPSGDAKCFGQLIVKSLRVAEAARKVHEESKIAPAFKELFADRSCFENQETKFECIVSGKPTPKVKWLFNGEAVSGRDYLVSTSGERQVLAIPTVNMSNQGKITCVAENDVGKATCEARLQVQQIALVTLPDLQSSTHIDTHSESSYSMKREVFTQSSSSSKMTSTINGGEPDVQVHSVSSQAEQSFKQINQQAPEIKESRKIEEFHQVNKEPAHISEKSYKMFTTGQDTKMQEVSTGEQRVVMQRSVRKSTAPRFITPVVGKIVDQGVDVTLEGILDGYPTPEVTWTKNGATLVTTDSTKVTWECNHAKLVLKNVTVKDAGKYTCTAVNEAGSAVSTTDLVVKKTIFPPVFGRRLQAQVIKKGDRLNMEVEVTGTPEPTITWHKDDMPLESALREGYRTKSQGCCHTLIIEKATMSHTGKYMVRAVNSGGETQSIADIAVFEPTPETMVEVVKTVVFEDVQKQENLRTADQIKSTTRTPISKPVTVDIPIQILPEQTSKTIVSHSAQSVGASSQSHISHVTENRVSQSVTKFTLEHKTPELPEMKPFIPYKPAEEPKPIEIPVLIQTELPKPIEIQMTIEPQPEIEGIETSSISKQSSLNFFESKLKEVDEPVKPKVVETQKISADIFTKFEEVPEWKKPESYTTHDVRSEVDSKMENGTNMYSSSTTQEYKQYTSSQSQLLEEFNLTPEPPPEMGYIPKTESTVQKREDVTVKIKKLEDSHRDLSPCEVPSGAVRIFPTASPKPKEVRKEVVEEICVRKHIEPTPDALHWSPVSFKSEPIQKQDQPLFRPQAPIVTRPLSPRPSAEAVTMEKLWTPSTPQVIAMPEYTEPVRGSSPKPSSQGIAMDKLWTQKSTEQKTTSYSTKSVTQSMVEPSAQGKTMEKMWAHKHSDSNLKTVWPPPEVEDKPVQKTICTAVDKSWPPVQTKSETVVKESSFSKNQEMRSESSQVQTPAIKPAAVQIPVETRFESSVMKSQEFKTVQPPTPIQPTPVFKPFETKIEQSSMSKCQEFKSVQTSTPIQPPTPVFIPIETKVDKSTFSKTHEIRAVQTPPAPVTKPVEAKMEQSSFSKTQEFRTVQQPAPVPTPVFKPVEIKPASQPIFRPISAPIPSMETKMESSSMSKTHEFRTVQPSVPSPIFKPTPIIETKSESFTKESSSFSKSQEFRSFQTSSSTPVYKPTPITISPPLMPVQHYIAESTVSHKSNMNDEQFSSMKSSTITKSEQTQIIKSQYENVIEDHQAKASEIIKAWPPVQFPKEEVALKAPQMVKDTVPKLDSLLIRPISVQDITDEFYLEPGPPPEIGFAEPPKERRQSYVESIEQDLEKNLEREPSRVLPGSVRTIPPPREKSLPPPLPPKKEQYQAPPVPAKPIKVEPLKKTSDFEKPFEKFPELEPFPFKAGMDTPKSPKPPPPPTPSKFIKGRFGDSDYESDFEAIKIHPKWKPCASDTEDLSFRKVKAPKLSPITRSRSTDPEPLPPSKFDHPPQFQGPPRPAVDLETTKRELKKDVSVKQVTKTTKREVRQQHQYEMQQQQLQQQQLQQQQLLKQRELQQEQLHQQQKLYQQQQMQHQQLQKVPSLPELIPGSPPIFSETPKPRADSPKLKPDSPKLKQKIYKESGYMADTDEPLTLSRKSTKMEHHRSEESSKTMEFKQFSQSFESQSSQKFETRSSATLPQTPPKVTHKYEHKKHLSSSTASKKELVAPVVSVTSQKTYHQKEERDSSLEPFPFKPEPQRPKKMRVPPPPSPSKFVKGDFKESDYESDYDGRIPPVWHADQDLSYKPVRPVLTPSGHQPRSAVRTPTPPTEFDQPPQIEYPPRPKFEPIEKPKQTVKLDEILKTTTKAQVVIKPKAVSARPVMELVVATPAAPERILKPGSPPEMAYAPEAKRTQYYRSVTGVPYHNATQTETSNIMHFNESTEKSHRVVSVQQTTKVIKFGESQTREQLEPFPFKPEPTRPKRTSAPPPPKPKRFVPGEFRESDYESEIENARIKQKWTPGYSDTDDMAYRKVRPPPPGRCSSVPTVQQRVVTPMEFDTQLPVISTVSISRDITDGESKRFTSDIRKRFNETKSSQTIQKQARTYKTNEVKLQPGTPPEYAFSPVTVPVTKASEIASQHMEDMTHTFKSKAQKFVNDIMTDVKTPQKPILKSTADGESDAQAYREESRVAQYGTKHIDPDTGLIYFKYDFGYEFGVVFPGASKNGEIPQPKKTVIQPPKRSTSIDMPVFHETTKPASQNQPATNGNAKVPQFHPKKFNANQNAKNVKWEPTSESEMSEFEGELSGNKKRHSVPSDMSKMTVPSANSRWDQASTSPVSLSPSLPSMSPAFNNTLTGGQASSWTSPGKQQTSRNHGGETPPSTPSTPGSSHPQNLNSTQPKRAPIFITPLRDIAAVSGQTARFECIVQSEPAPSILWSKNGRIIENSIDYQLQYRNGVCRLTIPQAYPEDAGTYTCTATNLVGAVNTIATLQVPGERRSSYI